MTSEGVEREAVLAQFWSYGLGSLTQKSSEKSDLEELVEINSAAVGSVFGLAVE